MVICTFKATEVLPETEKEHPNCLKKTLEQNGKRQLNLVSLEFGHSKYR